MRQADTGKLRKRLRADGKTLKGAESIAIGTECTRAKMSASRRMLPQRSTRTSSSVRRFCVPDGRRLAATLTDSLSTDESAATGAASATAAVDEGAEEGEPTGPAAVATAG